MGAGQPGREMTSLSSARVFMLSRGIGRFLYLEGIMDQMKIVYLSPDELTPYERNAKLHPDDQVEHIANSIREFGFRQPLVIDANNVVVIGHGRLLAAKRLGLDKVPVIKADDLSEAQIKALRLADNKTNESEWDFDALEVELDELADEFEMSDFGFEDIQGASEPYTGQGATEYSEEVFGDDKFKCECPRCGFKFNP